MIIHPAFLYYYSPSSSTKPLKIHPELHIRSPSFSTSASLHADLDDLHDIFILKRYDCLITSDFPLEYFKLSYSLYHYC